MGKGALLAVAICVFSMLADPSWAQVFGGGRVPGTRFDPPAERSRDSGREPPNSPDFRLKPEATKPRTFEHSTDLYRADPGTYAPGPIRLRDRRWFQGDYGYGYGADFYVPARPMPSYSPSRNSVSSVEVSGNVSRNDAPLPVVRIAEPGPPKTFYVIPRCFAGDTPPRPDQLPAGCNLKDLRVVPPVN